MTRVYSIGHSTQTAQRLMELLRRHGVTLVADVRSFPASRRNPQFNREPLTASLAAAGIGYEFLGRELGGKQRARAEEFERGIERLIALAGERPMAMMCAEENPDDCHRRLLITPALVERGVEVWHIRGSGAVEPEPASLFVMNMMKSDEK